MRKIKVGNREQNQNVFFTGDLHFNHKNILLEEYSNRPFESIEEMNESLIQNWNSVVSKKDIVFNLGDFVFHLENNVNKQKIETESFLQRLNGHKHLIIGNHDSRGTYQAQGWASVDDVLQIKCFGEQSIILSHYAQLVWKNFQYGYWQCFAHSHGTLGQKSDFHSNSNLISQLLDDMKMIDVGVDCHNYYPISFDQVSKLMEKKIGILYFDHHRKPVTE